MARLDTYSDSAFESLLASVPEEYREALQGKRAGKKGSPPAPYPEGFRGDGGGDGAELAYARLRSAPMRAAARK